MTSLRDIVRRAVQVAGPTASRGKPLPEEAGREAGRRAAAADFLAGSSGGERLLKLRVVADEAARRWLLSKRRPATAQARAPFGEAYTHAMMRLHQLPLLFDPRHNAQDLAGRREACRAFVERSVCFHCWHELSHFGRLRAEAALGDRARTDLGAVLAFEEGFLEAARGLRGE